MMDGNTSMDPRPAEPTGGPNRGMLVAGAVAGVLVLAAIGATGGWLIADAQLDGDVPTAIGTTTATAPTPPKTSSAKTTKPTPARSTTSHDSGGKNGDFSLPNLVGMDFRQARQRLDELNLGWYPVFGDAGEDTTVVSTDPPANASVHAGITVKLMVRGAAPSVSVPNLFGMSCAEAGKAITGAGLSPRYPSGKDGPVLRQDPKAGAERQWNDTVQVYCGLGEAPPPTA